MIPIEPMPMPRRRGPMTWYERVGVVIAIAAAIAAIGLFVGCHEIDAAVEDPCGSRGDLRTLKAEIDVLTREVRGLRAEVAEYHSDVICQRIDGSK